MLTLRPYVILGVALYAVTAGAQFTGTVAAVSDYRFRGISLSRERPAAQVTITYDAAAGVYGGMFASTVSFASSSTTIQTVGFLGTAVPISNDLHGDVGINYAAFGGNLRDYSYGEAYAGVSSAELSASVHYSPDYFSASSASLYAVADITHPITNGIALLGHIGVLVPFAHRDVTSPHHLLDARAGIGVDFAGFNLQLAWVAINPARASYPIDNHQRDETFVVSILRAF